MKRDCQPTAASPVATEETYPEGEAGLAYLVEKGYIRPANDMDAEMWLDAFEAAQRKTPTQDIPPVAGKGVRDLLPKLPMRKTYVVLKDFNTPAGLFGARAPVWLVMKGVTPPQGRSHASVFDMNTVTCYGFIAHAENEVWCQSR